MTHYETMDLVLNVFVTKRKSLTFQDISDGVQEMADGEIIRGIGPIVEQLVEDDYLKLDFEDIEREPYEEDMRIGWYSLKSKGKAFSESGGYSGLYKLKSEQRRIAKYTFVLAVFVAVGTLVAAAYYTLEVLDKIYSIYPKTK